MFDRDGFAWSGVYLSFDCAYLYGYSFGKDDIER